MINSRDLKDLHPIVAEKAKLLIEACNKRNIFFLVTSTYRDNESQNDLYAQGRTKKGLKVTNATGGNSFHQYRVAFDVVPVVGKALIWDDKNPLWTAIIEEAHKLGFTSGNDWSSFKEKPHLQFTGKQTNYNLALNHFKKGGKLEELL